MSWDKMDFDKNWEEKLHEHLQLQSFFGATNYTALNMSKAKILEDVAKAIAKYCDDSNDVRWILRYLGEFKNDDWNWLLRNYWPDEKRFIFCSDCQCKYDVANHIYRVGQMIPTDNGHLTVQRSGIFNKCPECLDRDISSAKMEASTAYKKRLTRKCVVCDHGYLINAHVGNRYEQHEVICPDCMSNIPQIVRRVHTLIKGQNNRAQKEGLQGLLTVEEWVETLNHFDFSCAYCGGDYEVIEHFTPVSMGGGTHRYNCVPACNKCNQVKRRYEPISLSNPIFDIERIKSIMRWLHISIDGDEQMQLPIAGD